MSRPIPKIIHYCWFGGNQLPPSARRCIDSWRRYMPDYEIKRWDESNFDVEETEFTADAYRLRKFAFVSDYARLKILNEQGGLYFDTDVQLLKPIDDIVEKGPFMGIEAPETVKTERFLHYVNVGLGFGSAPGSEVLGRLLELYRSARFVNPDGRLNTIPIGVYTTSLLEEYGYRDADELQQVGGFTVYPSEVFCPMNFHTGKTVLTDHTRSIHLYDATWLTPEIKLSKIYRRRLSWLPKQLNFNISNFIAYTKLHGLRRAFAESLNWLKRKK